MTFYDNSGNDMGQVNPDSISSDGSTGTVMPSSLSGRQSGEYGMIFWWTDSNGGPAIVKAAGTFTVQNYGT